MGTSGGWYSSLLGSGGVPVRVATGQAPTSKGLGVDNLRGLSALTVAVLAVLAAACSGGEAIEDDAQGAADARQEVVAKADCRTFGEFAQLEEIMANERSSHSALALADGRVLVVGGRGKGGARWPRLFPHTEIYDPATGQWTPSGDMAQEREFFTLISLGDGGILAAGGTNVQLDPSKGAEVRDPESGQWAAVSKMSTGRERGAAVLLSDGRVLYTGGKNKNLREQESTEIFDPASGEWTEAAPMNQARSIHSATLLGDGRVLVAGGGKPEGPFFATAEIYDPVADAWTLAESMRLPRILHTATLLADGRVLVVGGKGEPLPDVDSQLRRTAEIFDPDTGRWEPAGEMAEGRAEHTATLLSDGTVLVIGSLGNKATSEIYDPASDTWYEAATMAETRYRHTATVLKDGTVLVVGGQSTDSVTINSEAFTYGTFAADGACATGVSGSESALAGVTPAEVMAEVEATATPVGGSKTSGRDASQFEFADQVLDASEDDEVTVAPLGTLVRLKVGQRMASPSKGDGLTVTFLEVTEDSRCPEGAECSEPGQAEIRVHIAWFGQDVGELSLTLQGGQTEPTIGTPGGAFFVALASLQPLPSSGETGSEDPEYTAEIAVFQK